MGVTVNLPKIILANELRKLVAKGASSSVETSGGDAVDVWSDILVRAQLADYLVQGEAGRTALHVFAEAVALDFAPEELLTTPNLAIRDCHGNTVVHEAAKRGQLDVIPITILTQAALTEKDLFGTTPLQYALAGGHMDTVPQNLITPGNLNLQDMHTSLIKQALQQRAFRYIHNLTPEGMAIIGDRERKAWLIAIKSRHLERELDAIVDNLNRDWSHIENHDAWRSL